MTSPDCQYSCSLTNSSNITSVKKQSFVKLRKVEGRLYIDENDELCDSEVDDLVRDLGHSTNYGDNDSGC